MEWKTIASRVGVAVLGAGQRWPTLPLGQRFRRKSSAKVATGRVIGSPNDVNAHEDSASPFGVIDLVGNVWQWTNEYIDEHTRSAVIRGGSYYHTLGSDWYFPSNEKHYRLDQHNKYLLMVPSLDWASTLGFRCAADSE
jgi:formylglycine-generating enzyme required for sulfatase activity